MVVHLTSKDVICQITFAHIEGDMSLCTACTQTVNIWDENCPSKFMLQRVILVFCGPAGFSVGLAWTESMKPTRDEKKLGSTDGQLGAFTCYLNVGHAHITTDSKKFGGKKGRREL